MRVLMKNTVLKNAKRSEIFDNSFPVNFDNIQVKNKTNNHR